jgi:hypothetical protein
MKYVRYNTGLGLVKIPGPFPPRVYKVPGFAESPEQGSFPEDKGDKPAIEAVIGVQGTIQIKGHRLKFPFHIFILLKTGKL